MKTKLLLVLLLTLVPVTSQASNWRGIAHYWDGIAHVLHPSGAWWTCDKYLHKCSW